MKSRNIVFRLYLSFFLILQIQLFGQNVPLSDYEIIQYITSSAYGPENIIKLDNNAEIVLACKSGKTEEQLNELGIRFNKSQIILLETYRILKEEKDGSLKTNLPILNEDETRRLRFYAEPAAIKLLDYIQTDIDGLIRCLESSNRTKNTYSILFSYVLDGMVWDMLETSRLIPEQEITAENPFWSGEVWAIYPPRKISCGTNTISDKGVEFKINWSEPAIPKMKPFFAQWKILSRMFDDYMEKGFVEDSEVKTVFKKYNLFDENGQFTIPIIEEDEDNLLYKISKEISVTIVKKIDALLDFSKIQEEFDFRDVQQTMVIVYHEIMWDMIKILAKQNIIRQPVLFSNPDRAAVGDISDLIFIVRKVID